MMTARAGTKAKADKCRGIVFGTIYGGIIYPPQQATYFPPAIVSVVIFGPVFAQSWFFGPSGVVVWSTTIFYRAGGIRIYNPSEHATHCPLSNLHKALPMLSH